jgi:hypothetical protein
MQLLPPCSAKERCGARLDCGAPFVSSNIVTDLQHWGWLLPSTGGDLPAGLKAVLLEGERHQLPLCWLVQAGVIQYDADCMLDYHQGNDAQPLHATSRSRYVNSQRCCSRRSWVCTMILAGCSAVQKSPASTLAAAAAKRLVIDAQQPQLKHCASPA